MTERILAIYKDFVDEYGVVGQDVWLTDGSGTYYIGMYTGVVGPYGSSTGYFQHFNTSYNLYDVAEELFGYDVVKLTSVTLNY
jgi:hypothetical protein